MQAAVVLKFVSGALQDLEPGIEPRWSWAGGDGTVGLLDFLNDAIRAVVAQRPDATIITEAILLEPGMRQTLPAKRHMASREATTLIELVRNMGNGGQPGRAIHHTNMEALLAWADPLRVGKEIENYAYDRVVNPKVYYVYPSVPENAEVWVEASYGAKPRAVAKAEQEIGIPDEYAPALQHYMLASILAGDNESSNSAKASYHMQMFGNVLGIKMQTDSSWPKTQGGA